MPAGLQLWDANGNMTLDTTDRLTQFLGQVGVGTGAGSVSVPQTGAGNKIWGYFIPDTMDVGTRGSLPIFSIDSSSISWTFQTSASGGFSPIGGTLLYGRY